MATHTKLSTLFKAIWFCLWLLLVTVFVALPQNQNSNYFQVSTILLSMLLGLTSFFLTLALTNILKFKQ